MGNGASTESEPPNLQPPAFRKSKSNTSLKNSRLLEDTETDSDHNADKKMSTSTSRRSSDKHRESGKSSRHESSSRQESGKSSSRHSPQKSSSRGSSRQSSGGDEYREEGNVLANSSSSGSRKRVPSSSAPQRAEHHHARRQSPLVMGGKAYRSPAPRAAGNHSGHGGSSHGHSGNHSGNHVAGNAGREDFDLPMADLMAYLQVVADNSSNLPLTRRDDPELGRTVSSLTGEEYETKCRAFVPANVRIFGGAFGRYGRVWDLPTTEVSCRLFIVHREF